MLQNIFKILLIRCLQCFVVVLQELYDILFHSLSFQLWIAIYIAPSLCLFWALECFGLFSKRLTIGISLPYFFLSVWVCLQHIVFIHDCHWFIRSSQFSNLFYFIMHLCSVLRMCLLWHSFIVAIFLLATLIVLFSSLFSCLYTTLFRSFFRRLLSIRFSTLSVINLFLPPDFFLQILFHIHQRLLLCFWN